MIYTLQNYEFVQYSNFTNILLLACVDIGIYSKILQANVDIDGHVKLNSLL